MQTRLRSAGKSISKNDEESLKKPHESLPNVSTPKTRKINELTAIKDSLLDDQPKNKDIKDQKPISAKKLLIEPTEVSPVEQRKSIANVRTPRTRNRNTKEHSINEESIEVTPLEEQQQTENIKDQKPKSAKELLIEPTEFSPVEQRKSIANIRTPRTKNRNTRDESINEDSIEASPLEDQQQTKNIKDQKPKSVKKLLIEPTEDSPVEQRKSIANVRTPRTRNRNTKEHSINEESIEVTPLEEQQLTKNIKDQKPKSAKELLIEPTEFSPVEQRKSIANVRTPRKKNRNMKEQSINEESLKLSPLEEQDHNRDMENQKPKSTKKLLVEPTEELPVEQRKSIANVRTQRIRKCNMKEESTNEESIELLPLDEPQRNKDIKDHKPESAKKLPIVPTEDSPVEQRRSIANVRTPRTRKCNLKEQSMDDESIELLPLDKQQQNKGFTDRKSKSAKKLLIEPIKESAVEQRRIIANIRTPRTKNRNTKDESINEESIEASPLEDQQQTKNIKDRKPKSVKKLLIEPTEDSPVEQRKSIANVCTPRKSNRNMKEQSINEKLLEISPLKEQMENGNMKDQEPKTTKKIQVKQQRESLPNMRAPRVTGVKSELTTIEEDSILNEEQQKENLRDQNFKSKKILNKSLPNPCTPRARNNSVEKSTSNVSLLDEQQQDNIYEEQKSMPKHRSTCPLKELNWELEELPENFSEESNSDSQRRKTPSKSNTQQLNIKDLTSSQKKDKSSEGQSLQSILEFLQCNDKEILADACSDLSTMMGDESNISDVVNMNAVPRLIHLLSMDDPSITMPILHILKHILRFTDEIIDTVIEGDGLANLSILLQHENTKIVKETISIVTNIAAGSNQHIQAVISAGIFQQIRQILEKDNFRLQKAAVRVVANTLLSGTPEQIVELIEKFKILKPFLDLLDTKDLRTTKIIQTVLIQLFNHADKLGGIDYLCLMVDQMGGVAKLEVLQTHEDIDVYRNAYTIIGTYFNREEKPLIS